jgi:hypothetical protein
LIGASTYSCSEICQVFEIVRWYKRDHIHLDGYFSDGGCMGPCPLLPAGLALLHIVLETLRRLHLDLVVYNNQLRLKLALEKGPANQVKA